MKRRAGSATAIMLGMLFTLSAISVSAQRRGGEADRRRLARVIEESRSGSEMDPQTIEVGDRERTFWIHYPSGGRSERMAVVISLHGGGGNGKFSAQATGFNQIAERERFIVVYPDGSGNRKDILLTWNAIGCCAQAVEDKVDDVAFIDALISKLSRHPNVDPKRIYVTGHSNGAMMTHLIGARLSDRVAAIAPVAGALFAASPKPNGKVPTLMINGSADTAVPLAGGWSVNYPVNKAQNAPYLSQKETTEFWAKNNGCSMQTAAVRSGNVERRSFRGCSRDKDVEYITVIGGNHAWPGGRSRQAGDEPSVEMNASAVIWEFFSKHRLQ